MAFMKALLECTMSQCEAPMLLSCPIKVDLAESATLLSYVWEMDEVNC